MRNFFNKNYNSSTAFLSTAINLKTNSSMQLITRVKYKDEKLTIQWEELRNGHRDKKSLESRIEPHADFVNAMRNLDEVLCTEGELPQGDDEYKRHDVQQIDLDYDENDADGNMVMSASITSERFMSKAKEPMKIQSPMKPETSSGDIALEPSSTEKIYKIVEEAKEYLGGKRHDLFSVTSGLTEEQAEAVGN